MVLTKKEYARATVDAMVENGLDCNAMTHRMIEIAMEELLESFEKDIREEILANAPPCSS